MARLNLASYRVSDGRGAQKLERELKNKTRGIWGKGVGGGKGQGASSLPSLPAFFAIVFTILKLLISRFKLINFSVIALLDR